MSVFNSSQDNKEIHGVTRVLTYNISPRDIVIYYLKGESFFSQEDQKLIGRRWGNEILTNENGTNERSEPDACVTDLTVNIESHSAGFKRFFLKKLLFNKETKKIEHKQFQSYIFFEKPNDRWQQLWKFELKHFLTGEEYLRVVKKGYQYIGSEEQCENQKGDYWMGHGEELLIGLDSQRELLTVYGNYGRFPAFHEKAYDDYKIPDKNIILQIHPAVKEFQLPDEEHDYEGGSNYRGNEKYREWQNKGSIFWSIALFDAYGIKERENLIIEPQTIKKNPAA